jgi:hypothetical protein
MDISPTTENLNIASRVKGEHFEHILQLDTGLIISMIVQRRPPGVLTDAGLKVLWLRALDSPAITHVPTGAGAKPDKRCSLST